MPLAARATACEQDTYARHPPNRYRLGLLVPQRDDGIHLGRAHGRVESEEDADGA